MFQNAKLRLLMTLASLERLGMEDVFGASWVVPSALASKDIKNSKTIIDQAIEKPIPEDQDPRELLQRKHPGSTGGNSESMADFVQFGDESEGEDEVPDGPLFPPNPRSKSNALSELKNKSKKKQNQDGEKEPLDEETLEERRRVRLENAQERQRKIKSNLFIHASDEDSDDDEEFFRLEEQRGKEQAERIKQALLIGNPSGKPGKKKGGRKRKSDEPRAQSKRQRRPPQSTDDGNSDKDDDDILMMGAGDGSPSSQKENEDTRPMPVEDDIDFDDDLAFSRDREKELGPADHDDTSASKTADAVAGDDAEEDEDAPPTAPGRRRMRAGFVIESDSE